MSIYIIGSGGHSRPVIEVLNEKNIKIKKEIFDLKFKKNKIKKYKIILEPEKKNTAPAILTSALLKDIPLKQPLMYFAADHLIEKSNILNKSISSLFFLSFK